MRRWRTPSRRAYEAVLARHIVAILSPRRLSNIDVTGIFTGGLMFA